MTKYETYIFPNGRVAMVDSEIINKALEIEKEVLIVCNAWSGGYAIAIGANKTYDPDFGEMYTMYSYSVREEEFTTEELSRFYKVIFTPGEMIYMETGDQANNYQDYKFIDWDSSVERINDRHYRYSWKNNLFTEEEIREKRQTINECTTVRHIYKDVEAKVQALIDRRILSEEAMKYVK